MRKKLISALLIICFTLALPITVLGDGNKDLPGENEINRITPTQLIMCDYPCIDED